MGNTNKTNMFREIHCNVAFNTNRCLLFILSTRSSLSLSLTHTIATDTHTDRSQRASFSLRCSAANCTNSTQLQETKPLRSASALSIRRDSKTGNTHWAQRSNSRWGASNRLAKEWFRERAHRRVRVLNHSESILTTLVWWSVSDNNDPFRPQSEQIDQKRQNPRRFRSSASRNSEKRALKEADLCGFQRHSNRFPRKIGVVWSPECRRGLIAARGFVEAARW